MRIPGLKTRTCNRFATNPAKPGLLFLGQGVKQFAQIAPG